MGRKNFIQSIKGTLSVNDLGFTLSHEHLICSPPLWMAEKDPDLVLDDENKAIEELNYFYQARGRSIVEASPIDYGRNVHALKRISEKTPVNIIFTTGFNKGNYFPDWVNDLSYEEIAEKLIKEIKEGIENLGVKPGLLKTGTSYNRITSQEEKVLKAVAKAHRETGAPIWLHTEIGTMGLEQLDILEKMGVNLEYVAIGHSDRNPDSWYHLKILERGAFVQFDSIGKVKYHPDSLRIELIKRICDKGYINKLLISGDMARKSYFKAYGGGPGLEFIIKKFVPRMLEEGFIEEEINIIFVKNPSYFLSFTNPY